MRLGKPTRWPARFVQPVGRAGDRTGVTVAGLLARSGGRFAVTSSSATEAAHTPPGPAPQEGTGRKNTR